MDPQSEVLLLAEPFECALQVSTIYFVTTTESAQADVLKTGANQRTFDLLLLRRGCNTIVNSAADPNRQTQKSGRRAVGFQRLRHLVFINSAEKKSAYVQGLRLGQGRSKPLGAFRAARDASKHHRPLRRFWPITMHHVQPRRQKREPPAH